MCVPRQSFEAHLIGFRSEQPPNKTRRKRRPRSQVFGYAANFKWLVDFSIRNGIDIKDDDNNSCFNAMMRIQKDARVRAVAVKSPEDPTRRVFCFPIAHNKSEEGLKGITRENIERLQRAMGGREDPPQWYVRS